MESKIPLVRSSSDPSLLSSETAQHAGSFTRQKTEALNRVVTVAAAIKHRDNSATKSKSALFIDFHPSSSPFDLITRFHPKAAESEDNEPTTSNIKVESKDSDATLLGVSKVLTSLSTPVMGSLTEEMGLLNIANNGSNGNDSEPPRVRRKSEIDIRKFIQEYKESRQDSDLSIIQPDEVKLEKELGKGSFGTVYAGVCRSQKVAIKLLHDQHIEESVLETFRNEVTILSTYHHPNIILYMGACTVPNHLMIVMEKMDYNLEDLLLGETKLSLLTRLKMAKGCALGMNWLHSANPMIIHRDLKPENILVDENLRVVITDFGLSERLTRGSEGMDTLIANGAITYISPGN